MMVVVKSSFDVAIEINEGTIPILAAVSSEDSAQSS
jgi:hypothetical protein